MSSTEEFALTIELGNAGMREPQHIAEALREIAESVDGGNQAGRVMDENGNTVGSWSVEYPEDVR